MPLAPELDTAGFLTRDPFLWGTAQKVLYDGLETFSSYPKKIYTYEFPTNASETDSDGILIDFVNKLAKFLSANVGPINLTSLWTKPANATSSLTDLLNITYPILISQEQTKLVRDPFYADYCKVHDRRTPFVDPAPLIRWAFGDSYPNSTLDEAVYNKTLFMNWFQANVTKPDSDTCSDSFFLYVGGTVEDDIQERNESLK
jgi:hypothetical protein